MKKVRITVTRGSQGKYFNIFNSPESLYVWLNDPELQERKLDSSLGNTIHLKKGEVMEVEWCGCEYIYEQDKLLFRADYIRIGKLISTPGFFSKGKNVVGIQDGWIVDDIIAFKSGTDDATRTTKLTTRSKHKFNLDELFLARKSYDEIEEDISEMQSDDQLVN